MTSITMGTARAKELQDSIQRELAVKGWASASDPVMAEFITIMIINSKSPDQITSELSELIGDDYDPEFTNWLFMEAADEEEEPASSASAAQASASVPQASASSIIPPTTPAGPRGNDSGLEPSTSATKRSRSPSDSGPAARKAPRTSGLPDRPRAMRDEPPLPIPVVDQPPVFQNNPARVSSGRSLLERVGPPPRFPAPPSNMNNNNFRPQQQGFDPVQAQINAVTAGGMGMPGFGPMGPMMSIDQMQMQELMQSQAMMLTQMNHMMQQMASSAAGGFNGQQQVGGPGFQGQNGSGFVPNGRGRGRGGPVRGTGRGGAVGGHQNGSRLEATVEALDAALDTPAPPPPPPKSAAIPIVAPQPRPAEAVPSPSTSSPAYTAPERPGTPTLCKFSVNCTNPVCRYSHPSPAATAESALVLSVEPCEKGIKCDDKDCTKSHPSPAILKPNANVPSPYPARTTTYSKPSYHPYTKPAYAGGSTVPCKFGSNCTRASCTFQHPAGRTTLPGEFHRGIKSTDPTVKFNPAQDKARLAAAASANRYNKTMTFNKPKPAATTPTSAASPVAETKPADSPKVTEAPSTPAAEPAAAAV